MNINRAFNQVINYINTLGTTGWAVVGAILVVVGVVCMRGYGSREYY